MSYETYNNPTKNKGVLPKTADTEASCQKHNVQKIQRTTDTSRLIDHQMSAMMIHTA
jgi:hypothetical protein